MFLVKDLQRKTQSLTFACGKSFNPQASLINPVKPSRVCSNTRLRGDTEVTPSCINYVFANRPMLKSLILMSAYFFVRMCAGTAGHTERVSFTKCSFKNKPGHRGTIRKGWRELMLHSNMLHRYQIIISRNVQAARKEHGRSIVCDKYDHKFDFLSIKNKKNSTKLYSHQITELIAILFFCLLG